RSLIAATSSSRFTEKNTWVDTKAGFSYSVQIQVPEHDMASINDIKEIPLKPNSNRPILGDVANITLGTTNGENDNLGAMPMLSVTANLNDVDLNTASKDVESGLASLGELPRGLTVELIGLRNTLDETMSSLEVGLLVAIVVIFLMLAANFQSFKVSGIILTTVP